MASPRTYSLHALTAGMQAAWGKACRPATSSLKLTHAACAAVEQRHGGLQPTCPKPAGCLPETPHPEPHTPKSAVCLQGSRGRAPRVLPSLQARQQRRRPRSRRTKPPFPRPLPLNSTPRPPNSSSTPRLPTSSWGPPVQEPVPVPLLGLLRSLRPPLAPWAGAAWGSGIRGWGLGLGASGFVASVNCMEGCC